MLQNYLKLKEKKIFNALYDINFFYLKNRTHQYFNDNYLSKQNII